MKSPLLISNTLTIENSIQLVMNYFRVMKKLVLFICFTCVFLFAVAQQKKPPFWNEIEAFKKEDSIHFPRKGAILFVGSSSIRGWRTLEQDFPQHHIINRGFGGSSLPDVIRYVDDIIFPYHPKQIISYCGENDLAGDALVTPQTVLTRFRQLFGLIRKKLPKASIVFVSIKPSPNRAHLMPKMVEANRLIENYLKGKKRTLYVDVYSKMLNEAGKPKAEIFLKDELHMNAKGYAIWKKCIEPVLLKN